MRGVVCSSAMVMVGLMVATASAQPAEPTQAVDVTRPLPSTFFLVTRMCKQTVAEIGSSLEKLGDELVFQSEASPFIIGCRKATDTANLIGCVLSSAEGTFLSSGKDTVSFAFMALRIGDGPIILQDIGGGNAIYLNASSGDAVTVSRQYIARDGVTRAFVKTCKAMLLNEQQFETLAKAGAKQGAPPAR